MESVLQGSFSNKQHSTNAQQAPFPQPSADLSFTQQQLQQQQGAISTSVAGGLSANNEQQQPQQIQQQSRPHRRGRSGRGGGRRPRGGADLARGGAGRGQQQQQRGSTNQQQQQQYSRPAGGVELPIDSFREQVLDHIRCHPVTCIQGETGCGKSTKVPQFILEDARQNASRVNIVVTQPRRIACISLAKRVAWEMGQELGNSVGFRISGEVRTSSRTDLTFMTTGYLLQLLIADPRALCRYSHVVLDEVHERSVDADLLSLVVKLQLTLNTEIKGCSTKIVIMSATLQYFAASEDTTPPTIFVGAKRYPVDCFYLNDLFATPVYQPGLGRQTPVPAIQSSAVVPELLAKNQRATFALQPLTVARLRQICAQFDRDSGKKRGLQPTVAEGLDLVVIDLIKNVAVGGESVLIFLPGIGEITDMFESLAQLERDSTARRSESQLNALAGRLGSDLSLRVTLTEELVDSPDHRRLRMNQSHPIFHFTESTPSLQRSAGHRWSFRIFVLHSLIPTEEQQQVFQEPPEDTVHVILASNVAESSLTLPRVRLVVDFCLRRQLIYDERRHLSALMRVWSSKASSQQRLGRTGRVFAGLCVRMVTKTYYETLPPYDPAEMLTAPLEKLYLQTKCLGYRLANSYSANMFSAKTSPLTAADEPLVFSASQLLKLSVEPPSGASISSAVESLDAIGALSANSEQAEITCLGHLAMQLPLDVKLSRLLYYSIALGVPADGIVFAACLSTQDPFTLPSHLVIQDPCSYSLALQRSLKSRIDFDGGTYSEPLMLRNMVVEWLREFAIHISRVHASRGSSNINMQLEMARSCKAFAQAYSIVPKRLIHLATSVIEVASRLKRLLDPILCERSLRDIQTLLHYLSVESKSDRAHEAICSGSIFSKDVLFLKALLAASFAPQFALGRPGIALPPNATSTNLGEVKLPSNKKARLIKLMVNEKVDPARTIVLRNIPKQLCTPTALKAALQLMCAGIDCDVVIAVDGNVRCAFVTFPPTRANQQFEPSSLRQSGHRAAALGHEDYALDWCPLPIVAHVLNQFGGARWSFPVPLPRGLSLAHSPSLADVRGTPAHPPPHEDGDDKEDDDNEDDDTPPQCSNLETSFIDSDIPSDLQESQHCSVSSRLSPEASRDTLRGGYYEFYEKGLMIDQPSHPCSIKWQLLGFWSKMELEALREAGSKRKCNYRNPVGFLATFPHGFYRDGGRKALPWSHAALYMVFVTQQGTSIPKRSWVEGATILPTNVAPKLLLAFIRQTFGLQCEVKAHLIHGVSITGLKLAGSQQPLPVAIMQKEPTTEGVVNLTFEDIADINALRRAFSNYIRVSEEQCRTRLRDKPRVRNSLETDPCVFVDRDATLVAALQQILKRNTPQAPVKRPLDGHKSLDASGFRPLSPSDYDGCGLLILKKVKGTSDKKLTETTLCPLFASSTESPPFFEPIDLSAASGVIEVMRAQWAEKVREEQEATKKVKRTKASKKAAPNAKTTSSLPQDVLASHHSYPYPQPYGETRLAGEGMHPMRQRYPQTLNYAELSTSSHCQSGYPPDRHHDQNFAPQHTTESIPSHRQQQQILFPPCSSTYNNMFWNFDSLAGASPSFMDNERVLPPSSDESRRPPGRALGYAKNMAYPSYQRDPFQ